MLAKSDLQPGCRQLYCMHFDTKVSYDFISRSTLLMQKYAVFLTCVNSERFCLRLGRRHSCYERMKRWVISIWIAVSWLEFVCDVQLLVRRRLALGMLDVTCLLHVVSSVGCSWLRSLSPQCSLSGQVAFFAAQIAKIAR